MSAKTDRRERQRRHSIKAEALVEAADGALYEAKRTGRDRVCVASGEAKVS